MKKSSLTTSVVAGLAGVAGLVNVSSALNVNPDGLGQVLIYPYYTVNGGNSTLLSVVNTTDDVKAVKVRFLEGRNSQEVFDFNLYLSPFDVWTAAVTDPEGDSDGPAVLFTNDTSCTVPAINGYEFLPYEYRNNNNDGGPYNIERTREGHVEMIEMGRVVDNGDVSDAAGVSVSAIDRQANPAQFATARLAFNAEHVNGVPRNCTIVNNAWNPGSGQWAVDANLDIDTPNGGLFGGAQIIDTSNGTNLSYNADAIEGFYVSESFDNLHANPGTVDPTLADAQSTDGGSTTAVIFDNGTLHQFTFTGAVAGRDAVSAVFMHNEIYNEYVTTSAVGADSEWVVTFPTKRLHIEDPLPTKLPFRSEYIGDDAAPWTTLIGACEPISFDFYDREEGEPGEIPGNIIPSPPPPDPEVTTFELCYEAQVVTFNQPTVGETLIEYDPSAVLGSSFARNINLCQVYTAEFECAATGTVFNEGWLRMTLGDPAENFMYTDLTPSGDDPNILVGLPATGFWAANYVNSEAQEGLLANYSGLHKHRADREAILGTVTDNSPADVTYTELDNSGV